MAVVYTHGHHESARDAGIATPERLERIAAGWRAWASAPDGWIALLHGEIICRV